MELATLLYVDVEDKDTVEKLKAKVSPAIAMIRGDKTRSALEIAQENREKNAEKDVKDLRRRRIHFDHAELVL